MIFILNSIDCCALCFLPKSIYFFFKVETKLNGKLQHTYQSMDRVFNSINGDKPDLNLNCFAAKLSSLQLKMLPIQLLFFQSFCFLKKTFSFKS
jgi:hypothetical protein